MAPLDQIDQIQDLVAEIDGVLRNDDRPWILGGRVRQRQRQTLEHLRSALTRLGGDLRQQATTPIVNLASPSDPGTPGQPPRLKSSAIAYGAAQTAIDTFTQDLQTLRTTLLQSLQTEVTSLQEQRDQLRREIQEMQRQAPGQTMLSEGMMQAFLQQLMLQLQERLSQQVQQSMAQQLAAGQSSSPLAIQPGDPTASPIARLAPVTQCGESSIDQAQLQFAQIQHLHDQSETLVRQVDSTLTVFAHTLEQNMQTYQQALEKGLEKMHSMGAQGEVLFAEFVNRLADRLEAQASAYFLANEGQSNSLSSSAIGPGQSAAVQPAPIQPELNSPAFSSGEPVAIGPGETTPKAFNVELGNIDLGPGFTPAPFVATPEVVTPGPVAMDLTDGTAIPLLPQANLLQTDQTAELTEVNWQSVVPPQPEPTLDIAARVRPGDELATVAPIIDLPQTVPSTAAPLITEPSTAAPSKTPSTAAQTEAPAAAPETPISRSRSAAEAGSAPTNELDAFYADLMILTGGMSVADRLVTTPIDAVAPLTEPPGTRIDSTPPLAPSESSEIAPAKRGSVDQEPVAQPPAPTDLAAPGDRTDVVQSLTDLFEDGPAPSASPSYSNETDRDVESELDNGLFAQYSVTGPADSQKKNLI